MSNTTRSVRTNNARMNNKTWEILKNTKKNNIAIGRNSKPNLNMLTHPNNSKKSNNSNIPEANRNHPQQFINDPSLPAGWRKVQLRNHPKVYWFEEESTQNRQWFPPGGNEQDPINLKNNNSLSPGWKLASHKINNSNPKALWYEHNSGETQWEKPEKPALGKNGFSNVFGTLNNLQSTLNKIGKSIKGGKRTRKGRKNSKRRKTRGRKH